jgi:hypothetical protein
MAVEAGVPGVGTCLLSLGSDCSNIPPLSAQFATSTPLIMILQFLSYRDSHSQVYFRSLACFLADFWDHKTCLPSQDKDLVQQLMAMAAVPNRAGVNKAECMHLLGMTRICLVRAIRGGMFMPEVRGCTAAVWPSGEAGLHKTARVFTCL